MGTTGHGFGVLLQGAGGSYKNVRGERGPSVMFGGDEEMQLRG